MKKIPAIIPTRYMFLFFFLLMAVLSYFILKPFLAVIVASLIIAYIFYPLYEKMNNKIKMRSLSAVITTVIVLFIILIPVVIFINTISQDAMQFYLNAKIALGDEKMLGDECANGLICDAKNYAIQIVTDPDIKQHLNSALTKIASVLLDFSSKLILSIPKIFISIIFMFFILFFALRDGKTIVDRIRTMLPLKHGFKKHLVQQIQDVIYATVYGNLIIAIIQGIIGTIAFLVLGLSSPVFWGLAITFFAFLPFVGASIIWIPAAAILLYTGFTTNNVVLVWKGIVMIFFGVVMSSIDVFIKPKIIGDRAKLHPILIFLGLFGGIALFGPIGIVLGPLILAIFISFIQVFEREKDEIIG